MPVPTIITQFGNPDPNAAPLNLTQLIQLLNTLVNTQMQGSYIPYVISSNMPGAQDHDKAWIQTDNQGRPLATKIWYPGGGGGWRRVYNGMLNEIRAFSGDPTVTTDWTSSGLGVVGGTYDGWHICNGQDGVIDLSDKFILPAHMNNLTIGYPASGGPWQTTIENPAGTHTGGNPTTTLDAAHTYLPPMSVRGWTRSATGDTDDAAGRLVGIHPSTFITDLPVNQNGTGTPIGNTTPTPIDIVNPYIALGWMIFVGYA